jgi:hypothetical protein
MPDRPLTSTRRLCRLRNLPCLPVGKQPGVTDVPGLRDAQPPWQSSEPTCASECKTVIREEFAEVCRIHGVPVPDCHITHVPPLGEPLYLDLRMRCPHGVVWHMQPTSEQMADWAREGAE